MVKNARPVGRPRMKRADRLSESLFVRLRRDEYDALDAMARREDKTLSELAREALKAYMKK